MRLFIALNFNELKDYFAELQTQIPKEGKFTFPKDFHLTLKFLGEVEDLKVEEIKKILSEIKFKQFEAKVTHVGVFTEQFVRVVWVKAESDEIINLQKKIDEKLINFRKDEFTFQPHITLARVKSVDDKTKFIEQIHKIRKIEKTVKIHDFELVKSILTPEGPVYEVVGKF